MFIPILIILPLFSLVQTLSKILTDVILAYFFNVSDIELHIEGIRKNDHVKIASASPKIGDVVITNGTGPFDWFIWKINCENPNKFTVGVATADGIVIIDNWLDWINWCFSGSLTLSKSNFKNVIHITDLDASETDADGLVRLREIVSKNTLFVILEGTLSNGKGILSIPNGFDACALIKMIKFEKFNLKIMSTKVSPMGICETVIPTNKLYWLFLNFGSLSMNLKYKLKLSVIEDFDALSEFKIREKMAFNGRMKILGNDMNIDKKRDYIKAVENNDKKKK